MNAVGGVASEDVLCVTKSVPAGSIVGVWCGVCRAVAEAAHCRVTWQGGHPGSVPGSGSGSYPARPVTGHPADAVAQGIPCSCKLSVSSCFQYCWLGLVSKLES